VSRSYRVSYQVTAAAMTDASRLYMAPFLARYRIVMGLISIAGLPVAAIFDPTFGLTMVIFGLLMLAMTRMEFLDRWLLGNRGRGLVGGANEYVLDDVGIHHTDATGSGVFDWSGLTTIRSSDKTIALGRDRILVAYIPTSAFASRAERDAVLAFAREHVPGSAEG